MTDYLNMASTVVKPSTVRLVLVEPETLSRSTLKFYLQSSLSYQIVAEVSNGADALNILNSNNPHLLFISQELPDQSGISVLHTLSRQNKIPPSLLMSRCSAPTTIRRAFAAGALGFICKEATLNDLGEALGCVSNGKRYISPTLAKHINQSQGTEAVTSVTNIEDPLCSLSEREREVFQLLASGMQNSEIAKKLYISPRTVETHRARVVRKLQLKSNAELIRFSIRNGLSIA